MKHNKTVLGIIVLALTLSACGVSRATNTPEPSVAIQDTPLGNSQSTIAAQSTRIHELSSESQNSSVNSEPSNTVTVTPSNFETQNSTNGVFATAKPFIFQQGITGYVTEVVFGVDNSARQGYRTVRTTLYLGGTQHEQLFTFGLPLADALGVTILDQRGFRYNCTIADVVKFISNDGLSAGTVAVLGGVFIPYFAICEIPNNAADVSLTLTDVRTAAPLLALPLSSSGYLASPNLRLSSDQQPHVFIERGDVGTESQAVNLPNYADLQLVSSTSDDQTPRFLLKVKNQYGYDLDYRNINLMEMVQDTYIGPLYAGGSDSGQDRFGYFPVITPGSEMIWKVPLPWPAGTPLPNNTALVIVFNRNPQDPASQANSSSLLTAVFWLKQPKSR